MEQVSTYSSIPSEKTSINESVGEVDFESIDTLTPLQFEYQEQPEEYLMRASDLVIDDAVSKGVYVLDEDSETPHFSGLNTNSYNPQYELFTEMSIREVIKHVDTESGDNDLLHEPFSSEKRARQMEKIKYQIRCSDNYGIPNEEDGTGFEHTNRSRRVFGKTRGYDNIPYQQSLFCVGTESDVAFNYIRSCIHDKNIMVLGGGISMNDLLFQSFRKSRTDIPEIKPRLVVNIDPFLRHEQKDKNKHISYISVPSSASDPIKVKEGMMESRVQDVTFDEIWASYSVPYYLDTPEEIEGLFEVITSYLADGGIARIFPLSVGDNSETADSYSELVRQIEALNNTNMYNVYSTTNSIGTTLFIRKLKKK